MGVSARTAASEVVSGIVIEAATAADLSAVAAIERAAFSDPWSPRAFRDALDRASVYFACARRPNDATVLGYIVAWFAAGEGEIANLAVAPDGWGQGIGK